MTRDEMIARMSSVELSGWMTLFAVQADEAKFHQDLRESGDGVVHISGLDEDEDDDGQAE